MLKKVIGVIVGYIAMSIALFTMFSGLYTILGTAGSFQEGSYSVTYTWMLVGFIVFLIAGAVAGFVAVLIGNTANTAVWMAGVILIFGLLMAVGQVVQVPADPDRVAAEIGLLDAMGAAQQPLWSTTLNAVMGFLGAIAAGKLRG